MSKKIKNCFKCFKEIPIDSTSCVCGAVYRRAGLWIRMSCEDSVNSLSHENHYNRAETYCNAHGLVIVKYYELLKVKGDAIQDEDEYWQYRYDVQNKFYDVFLITALARFARTTQLLIQESIFLNEHNVDLISISEQIDTTTIYGKFFFILMAALAELEKDTVSQRIKESVKPRAEAGRCLGNKAPYGFSWKE